MSARPELDPVLDPLLVEAIQQQAAQLKLYRETAECRELTAQLDERDRIVAMIASQRATPLQNQIEQEGVIRVLRRRLEAVEQQIIDPACLQTMGWAASTLAFLRRAFASAFAGRGRGAQ